MFSTLLRHVGHVSHEPMKKSLQYSFLHAKHLESSCVVPSISDTALFLLTGDILLKGQERGTSNRDKNDTQDLGPTWSATRSRTWTLSGIVLKKGKKKQLGTKPGKGKPFPLWPRDAESLENSEHLSSAVRSTWLTENLIVCHPWGYRKKRVTGGSGQCGCPGRR